MESYIVKDETNLFWKFILRPQVWLQKPQGLICQAGAATPWPQQKLHRPSRHIGSKIQPYSPAGPAHSALIRTSFFFKNSLHVFESSIFCGQFNIKKFFFVFQLFFLGWHLWFLWDKLCQLIFITQQLSLIFPINFWVVTSLFFFSIFKLSNWIKRIHQFESEIISPFFICDRCEDGYIGYLFLHLNCVLIF